MSKNIVIAPNVTEYKAWVKKNMLRWGEFPYVNNVTDLPGHAPDITVYDLGGDHPNKASIMNELDKRDKVRYVHPNGKRV